jgi:hypothetical protein
VENIATQGSEVRRAEPESEHDCSPVQRRNVQSSGDVEGPGAERREAPPASGLPCLFETTASKDEVPPLPGPRKKQAEALTQNIQWMAATFGKERIGFLTLTLGDFEAGGKYRNLRDRKEAQRRFHSLLTNEISKRYVCGVTVTERHKNGGIHFHMAVACKEDIRGQIDFAACFPPKGVTGKPVYKPDYSTANEAIKREWALLAADSKAVRFRSASATADEGQRRSLGALPGRISAQGLGTPSARRQRSQVCSLLWALVK